MYAPHPQEKGTNFWLCTTQDFADKTSKLPIVFPVHLILYRDILTFLGYCLQYMRQHIGHHRQAHNWDKGRLYIISQYINSKYIISVGYCPLCRGAIYSHGWCEGRQVIYILLPPNQLPISPFIISSNHTTRQSPDSSDDKEKSPIPSGNNL